MDDGPLCHKDCVMSRELWPSGGQAGVRALAAVSYAASIGTIDGTAAGVPVMRVPAHATAGSLARAHPAPSAPATIVSLPGPAMVPAQARSRDCSYANAA